MISTTSKSEIIKHWSPSDYKGHSVEKIGRTKPLFFCQARLRPLQSMTGLWNKTLQLWKEPVSRELPEPCSWALPLGSQMEFPSPENVSVAPAISQCNLLLWAFALGKDRETLLSLSQTDFLICLSRHLFLSRREKYACSETGHWAPSQRAAHMVLCSPVQPTALSLTGPAGVGFLLVFLLSIIWFCWRVPHCPSSSLLSHGSLLCVIC